MAAEEDIESLQQQMATENSRISLENVSERNGLAKKLIDEENDELKLIQSNCHKDLDSISKIIHSLASVI